MAMPDPLAKMTMVGNLHTAHVYTHMHHHQQQDQQRRQQGVFSALLTQWPPVSQP